jgi:hypothetical protein
VNFRRNGAGAEKTLRLQYLTTILSYLVDEYKFARDIHSSGCVCLNTLAAGREAIPLAICVTAKFSFRKGTGPMNATGQSNIRITNLAKDPSMRLPLVVQKANPRQ